MNFFQNCFSIIFSFCGSLLYQLFKYTPNAELVKVDNFKDSRLKNTELIKVDNFKDSQLKNVALLLFVGNKRMLTVTEKNGKVGLPAGRLVPNDRTVFDGLNREFCEETGNEMPALTKIERFVYHGHTRRAKP